METRDYHFDFLITEYQKLKDEQMKRIGFRDNMIYLTLTAIGGVFSFALLNTAYLNALLILPFIISILAWLFISNDEKISSIGDYYKTSLIPKIQALNSANKIDILNTWESYHKLLSNRKERKIFQLIFDLITFCFSSLTSIFILIHLSCYCISIFQIILICFETLLVLFLIIQFFRYSDIK